MPIIIPESLPAASVLANEGIEVIQEAKAARQDIRPLRVALLNLMPDKVATETQFARLLGATPLQIDLHLLVTGSYTPKNVPPAHLKQFYRTWGDVAAAGEKFDALIITGAPVEHLPFEQVEYWPELAQIFDWATTHVHETLAVCWGAQAALYHHYRVPKHDLPFKRFGLFRHRVCAPSLPLLRGFNDMFEIPVSRHTEVRRDDLAQTPVDVLLDSAQSGLALVRATEKRLLCMFNHWEYDTDTLAREYWRDKDAGKTIAAPDWYFPTNNPDQAAVNSWRAHGYLFFNNWINGIYQTTPFDLASL